MKNIFIIFYILINFQYIAKADDISNFEIEGISVGDSALIHFSNKDLNKSLLEYKSDKYLTSSITLKADSDYEVLQLSYLKKDKKKKIVDINGIVDQDYSKCLKKIKVIEKDFDSLFSNYNKQPLDTYEHAVDKSGKSKVSDIIWRFQNGDVAILACYTWNPNYEGGYPDEFRVAIGTKEFDNFLIYEAY